MTLVITALKPQFVVQLSDMRLTDLRTQAVRDEEQRKAIVLNTADARVAVGWCGFANDRHNGNNTGDWLTDELARLASQQSALRLPDFINELVARATVHFQSITEPLDDKACSVVMAGWAWPRPDTAIPVTAIVSNCEDSNGARIPVRDAFSMTVHFPSEKPTREPNMVTIIGTEEAIPKELGKALLLLLRRDPTPMQVMDGCLRLMREAIAHKTYGNLIGHNWVGVEMRLDSPDAVAHYFAEHDSPQQFMPNLVSPQQSFKDARIWAGPGAPPWWKH